VSPHGLEDEPVRHDHRGRTGRAGPPRSRRHGRAVPDDELRAELGDGDGQGAPQAFAPPDARAAEVRPRQRGATARDQAGALRPGARPPQALAIGHGEVGWSDLRGAGDRRAANDGRIDLRPRELRPQAAGPVDAPDAELVRRRRGARELGDGARAHWRTPRQRRRAQQVDAARAKPRAPDGALGSLPAPVRAPLAPGRESPQIARKSPVDAQIRFREAELPRNFGPIRAAKPMFSAFAVLHSG